MPVPRDCRSFRHDGSVWWGHPSRLSGLRWLRVENRGVLEKVAVMTWDVQFRGGIWLPQIGWWLDPHHPVERAFVSHAHFDHLGKHREIVCSTDTARLMRVRMPDESRKERALAFRETWALNEQTTATLYPAGHIFGSAMVLLEHREWGRLLYTGDFKLRPGLSAERCEPVEADVVIMETTYGREHYSMPPTSDVLAAVVGFCRETLADGEVPVLFGYSLGKSQEILCSLAEAALPIMLHPQTLKLTQVCEELGLATPPYRAFRAEEAAGHVVICPPQTAQGSFLKKIRRARTAAITGWALDPGARFRYQCDAVFALSDHADYPDLLRLVELTRAKRVWTVHGFAEDFAATLRARGVEGWALGRENQLELLMGQVETGTWRREERGEADDESGGEWEGLAKVGEAVGATSGKLKKVRQLAEYFAGLPAGGWGPAARFLTGMALVRTGGRTLGVGWAALKRVGLEVAGANAGDYRKAYLRYQDGGETLEAMLAGKTRGERWRLVEAAAWFERVAEARVGLAKLGLVEARVRTLSPRGVKYLIKVMTGDLRIGLKEGLVEEGLAAATGQALEEVRRAHLLAGDLGEVAEAARAGKLGEIGMRVFAPVQCMLASPEPTAEAVLARLCTRVWLEEKYDGIRCQLHKRGGRVELYSRDLKRVTEQFADLVAEAMRVLPEEVVLDGELLAWRGGRALPFAELQKRLGRRAEGDDLFLGEERPVGYSAFDLLWSDGRGWLEETLEVRRAGLEAVAQAGGWAAGWEGRKGRFHLAPITWAGTAEEVEAAFTAARERGNEGLMAKDPASAYTPGRRGSAWVKFKKVQATLDVVVVGVEMGHGKRKGVLSDYTFAVREESTGALRVLGKAYSGLTNAEIAALTEHFLATTREEKGRVRLVEPDTVLEVAFDAIQASARHDSGLALRFPRIVRVRTDKGVAEIDTVETCRRLAQQARVADMKA